MLASMVTPALSSRLPGVGTTIFTVMSQLAAEHRAVNLAQGFPDFEPPERLRALVTQYLESGHNQYAPMAGVLALREAIAEKIAREHGRSPSPGDEITVTCGATEALASAILATVGPGDEAILLEPCYDSYEPVIALAGGAPVRVPLLRPAFAPDWEALARALGPRTRLVVVNSPHNPSGALLDRAELDRLAALLRPTRALLLADEAYEHVTFDGARHESVHGHPELRERAFVVSSFGKTFHATGWKVGSCVAPPPLTAELRKVHQFVTFAIATPIQHALAAFLREAPEVPAALPAFYQERRDRFLALLEGSRFRATPARGTYFQLLDCSAVTDLPEGEFALALLREHGVAAIPVSAFCQAPPPGERLLRFCFAKPDPVLQAAAQRLRAV
jgi:methionine aminotransferase